jgi:hypothetical protein
MSRMRRSEITIKFFKWHPPVYIELDMVIVFSDGKFLTSPNSFTQWHRKAGSGSAA